MSLFYNQSLHNIGVVVVLYLFAKLVTLVVSYFGEFYREKQIPGVVQSMQRGKWAIITGAGAGLGRSFAVELARRGMNVVLISRFSNEEQRQEIESIITKDHNRKVIFIKNDFKNSHEDNYKKIADKIKDLDVSVLVNNVGIGSTVEFQNHLENEAVDLINCNMISTVKMTPMVLPMMLKSKTGMVINISSVLSALPGEHYAVYGSTKRFITNFTEALHYEYASKNLIIQAIEPALVYTRATEKMCNYKPSLDAPHSDDFVRHTFKCLGKNSCSYGYWLHRLQSNTVSYLPAFIYRYILRRAAKNIQKLDLAHYS